DEARAIASELAEHAQRENEPTVTAHSRSVLGFVELADGEPAKAWAILDEVVRQHERSGWREFPFPPPVFVNAIEAAVGAGALDRARELTIRLTRRAHRLDSLIGLAGAARGAGLIAAAEGAPERAFAAFGRSLAACDRGPLPFERARTLLALGTAQRRARRRG